MSFPKNAEDASDRAYGGNFRGTIVKADDSKKMQEVEVRGTYGKKMTGVEVWMPPGFSFVPMPPKDEQEAEVVLLNMMGAASHPVAMVSDRRSRPKDLPEGDAVFYDPRDNRRRVHFTKEGGLVLEVPEDTTITHKIGSVTFTHSKDGIDITGGYIKHDGKRIGSDHVHNGVQPGSDNTGTPQP